MSAGNVTRLVVLILGTVAALPVIASAAYSLIHSQPITADVMDVAKVALGFVGGVLSQAHPVQSVPTQVEIVDQPVKTEDV